jgi:hemerythrin-like metal-binding protein
MEFGVLAQQHGSLFALASHYSASIRSRPQKFIVLKMIEDIVRHAECHFQREENLLARLPKDGAPRSQRHRKEHRRILDELLALIDSIDNDDDDSWRDREHAMDSLVVHHLRYDSERAEDWLKYLR